MAKPCYSRHLFGLTLVSANDLAHLDIITNSYIVSVQFIIEATPNGSAIDVLRAELSLNNTFASRTNDSQNIIAVASLAFSLVTVTAVGLEVAQGMANVVVPNMYYYVPANTRCYLNTNVAGTISANGSIQVHMMLQPV